MALRHAKEFSAPRVSRNSPPRLPVSQHAAKLVQDPHATALAISTETHPNLNMICSSGFLKASHEQFSFSEKCPILDPGLF